ncbi:hypothetical protein KPB2_5547 [Klebsiella pneumoniae Kb677]|nr:hypothetical protein KPB2_5547 [Klebsiella pneumoniae Kb677]
MSGLRYAGSAVSITKVAVTGPSGRRRGGLMPLSQAGVMGHAGLSLTPSMTTTATGRRPPSETGKTKAHGTRRPVPVSSSDGATCTKQTASRRRRATITSTYSGPCVATAASAATIGRPSTTGRPTKSGRRPVCRLAASVSGDGQGRSGHRLTITCAWGRTTSSISIAASVAAAGPLCWGRFLAGGRAGKITAGKGRRG